MKSCLCFDSSTSIPVDHDPNQYSITTFIPSQQPLLSSVPPTVAALADLETSLETSILAFEATNCEVIQLNLREFVFGLVGLYLGGAVVGAIDILVAICIWLQEGSSGRSHGKSRQGYTKHSYPEHWFLFQAQTHQ